MLKLVSINENKATTTSMLIAESFDKRHADILRSINQLECSAEFNERNFAPVAYRDIKGELRPMFNITRDGFTWLAMGFTGKKAAEFKEKFIAAFNRMEQALLEGQGQTKRIDIEHNRSRRRDNPNNIDIKYTLDLTKIALKPTRAGLDMIEQLTGIDMSGINLHEGLGLNREQNAQRKEIKDFIDQRCQIETGVRAGASELYNAYLLWRDDLTIRPASGKIFGGTLIGLGFERKKRGSNFYLGIRLLDK